MQCWIIASYLLHVCRWFVYCAIALDVLWISRFLQYALFARSMACTFSSLYRKRYSRVMKSWRPQVNYRYDSTYTINDEACILVLLSSLYLYHDNLHVLYYLVARSRLKLLQQTSRGYLKLARLGPSQAFWHRTNLADIAKHHQSHIPGRRQAAGRGWPGSPKEMNINN